MGYWIGASPKMQYKERFAPCESLQNDLWKPHPSSRWQIGSPQSQFHLV